ncbi:hypothetical protein FF011L_54100 [Roseimaritima multifibrata]|uniref:GYF domain-containing protein n=1 Tax=Roseimaritima multifibrata TaxID=1930274 RepID=A0A517MNY6_9BACT|nr:hypothetical protein FF011L_54100 [Roseimaritima multifibrata]
MSEWFIQQAETELGPISSTALLDRIRDGSICQSTMVRKNDSAWFQAGSVGGLFEAAAQSTTEYFCPQCKSKVRKPPCFCPKCKVELKYARPKVTEHPIPGMKRSEKPKPQKSASVGRWLQRIKSPGDQNRRR